MDCGVAVEKCLLVIDVSSTGGFFFKTWHKLVGFGRGFFSRAIKGFKGIGAKFEFVDKVLGHGLFHDAVFAEVLGAAFIVREALGDGTKGPTIGVGGKFAISSDGGAS